MRQFVQCKWSNFNLESCFLQGWGTCDHSGRKIATFYSSEISQSALAKGEIMGANWTELHREELTRMMEWSTECWRMHIRKTASVRFSPAIKIDSLMCNFPRIVAFRGPGWKWRNERITKRVNFPLRWTTFDPCGKLLRKTEAPGGKSKDGIVDGSSMVLQMGTFLYSSVLGYFNPPFHL